MVRNSEEMTNEPVPWLIGSVGALIVAMLLIGCLFFKKKKKKRETNLTKQHLLTDQHDINHVQQGRGDGNIFSKKNKSRKVKIPFKNNHEKILQRHHLEEIPTEYRGRNSHKEDVRIPATDRRVMTSDGRWARQDNGRPGKSTINSKPGKYTDSNAPLPSHNKEHGCGHGHTDTNRKLQQQNIIDSNDIPSYAYVPDDGSSMVYGSYFPTHDTRACEHKPLHSGPRGGQPGSHYRAAGELDHDGRQQVFNSRQPVASGSLMSVKETVESVRNVRNHGEIQRHDHEMARKYRKDAFEGRVSSGRQSPQVRSAAPANAPPNLKKSPKEHRAPAPGEAKFEHNTNLFRPVNEKSPAPRRRRSVSFNIKSPSPQPSNSSPKSIKAYHAPMPPAPPTPPPQRASQTTKRTTQPRQSHQRPPPQPPPIHTIPRPASKLPIPPPPSSQQPTPQRPLSLPPPTPQPPPPPPLHLSKPASPKSIPGHHHSVSRPLPINQVTPNRKDNTYKSSPKSLYHENAFSPQSGHNSLDHSLLPPPPTPMNQSILLQSDFPSPPSFLTKSPGPASSPHVSRKLFSSPTVSPVVKQPVPLQKNAVQPSSPEQHAHTYTHLTSPAKFRHPHGVHSVHAPGNDTVVAGQGTAGSSVLLDSVTSFEPFISSTPQSSGTNLRVQPPQSRDTEAEVPVRRDMSLIRDRLKERRRRMVSDTLSASVIMEDNDSFSDDTMTDTFNKYGKHGVSDAVNHKTDNDVKMKQSRNVNIGTKIANVRNIAKDTNVGALLADIRSRRIPSTNQW